MYECTAPAGQGANSGSKTGLYIGIAVGVICLVLIIILLVFVYYKKRSSTGMNTHSTCCSGVPIYSDFIFVCSVVGQFTPSRQVSSAAITDPNRPASWAQSAEYDAPGARKGPASTRARARQSMRDSDSSDVYAQIYEVSIS